MAYATPADLASFLQVPSVDTASANLYLQMGADAIDAECGQSLGQQDVVDLLLDGPASGSAELVLPGFPVTAIASLEVQEPDGTWTALVDGTDFHWSASGVVDRIFSAFDPNDPVQPAWPTWAQSIRASYSRGEGAVPSAAKTVNLMIAGRLYINPGGIQSEQIGGMSLRYSAKGGLPELSPMELKMLGRLTDYVIA